MFKGLYEHSIDGKGRTSFPARFREALTGASASGQDSETLVVTTGLDCCLVAYPMNTWRTFEERVSQLSQFDPAVVRLKRIYVAAATECSLDKHGRLLLPPMLREYAQLDKDVVWAGMVTTIEIWSKDLWQQQSAMLREDRQSVAKALTELGL